MKSYAGRAALVCACALFALGHGARRAAAQTTPTPTPSGRTETAPAPTTQQAGGTERERRAQAYAKILEGQRYLSDLRRDGSSATLASARRAFQDAAALDPKLAEPHTALAEIAFYYPPQDFEGVAREGAHALRLDPNSYGAHRVLARLFTIRSGLREGNLNRQFADLAVRELKEVARLDRNSAEAWALLGEFYFATNRPAEAIEAWTRWGSTPPSTDTRFFQYITNRELTPDSAAARLAEGLLSAGRAKEALAAVRRAIGLDPEKGEYVEILGRVIESGGVDDQSAIAELQRMVAADPANVSMSELLARVQARAGRTDEAASTLRSAIGRRSRGDRERQSLRSALAQLYADAQRYSDAIAVYEEQLKERGLSEGPLATDDERAAASIILQRMLEVYKRAGRPADVNATIERMRAILGKDDPTPDAQQIRYLREQGKRNEALQAVRAARQRFPDQPAFARMEAQALADLGRVDEGVALLRKLLKGSIEDFEEHLAISSLYLQAARPTEAAEAARKALELAPAERPDMADAALFSLSSAQERAGDPKGSEESLRRILARDPNNATALNNLGYFLVERNERLNEALEMIQRAVRANPNNTSFLDSLGWVYFKLGKLDEAERHLTEAARRNTASATIQEHLGDVYQKRGKADLARTAWQKALTLAVEPGHAARLRAKISGKTEK